MAKSNELKLLRTLEMRVRKLFAARDGNGYPALDRAARMGRADGLTLDMRAGDLKDLRTTLRRLDRDPRLPD